MKSNSFLRLITFFVCIIFSFSVRAEELTEAEAKYFGETKGQELIDTFSETDLKVKYQKLDELFLNYIDLKYIAKFVVGKFWRQMDSAQQQKYQDLFVRYAVSVYKGFPLDFSKDNIDFSISSTQKDGKYVLLSTDVQYRSAEGKDATFPIELRLHKQQGKIMLTDIKVADKSLILSYRSKFTEMIQQADEEPEWFLEDFELLTESGEQYYREKAESI